MRGSELPLSFVFIGLGEGSFEHLKTLDADHIALYSKTLHRSMSRDIVQFVPFKEFSHDLDLFSEQVFEEIPRQLVEYFNMKSIVPNEKKIKNHEDLKRRNSLNLNKI